MSEELREAFRPDNFACGACQGRGWLGPRNHDDPRYNPCTTCGSTGLRQPARDALAALAVAERERDEEVTQHHSLRWVLGLDSHEGEEPISDEDAVKALLALRVSPEGKAS
jgi:hypothetical protein